MVHNPNQAASSTLRRSSRRRFSPRLWSIIATLLGCSAFIALGFWQIARGLERAHYDAQMRAAENAAPVVFSQISDAELPPVPEVRAVRARGRYLPDKQLLLVGQSIDDRDGYDVLTPLQLDDGRLLIVNRGWIPASSDPKARTNLSVSANEREVNGLWRALPAPGLRLEAHNCRNRSWPREVSYPTPADLRCLYGESPRAGLLQLDPKLPDGYVRRWTVGDAFPPMRHYGYAAQWFGFCALALFLFLKLSFK